MLAISIAAVTAVAVIVRSASDAAPRPSAVRGLSTAQNAPAHKLSPPTPFPGFLLIADRGNNRMLLVDGAKRIYWAYPGPKRQPAMPFRFGDDTFFGPRADRIISNQEDQHTIQIISFPGRRILWRYGHVNVKGHTAGYLNTPDDAYLLRNGLVSVADAYNCRVLFISPSHKVVRQYGSGVCRHNPPTELGAVNGATPLADGGTLVSEITGSWIDNFGPNGQLRWAVAAPVSYPSDPQLLAPNRILLADYAHPGGALIMTRTGRVLWRYAPSSGPGELDHPSLATRIAPGLIAINDDYRHRVILVSLRTKKIVWQYGHTDVPGARAGYLHTPDGLDLLPTSAAQRLPAVLTLLSSQDRTSAPTPPQRAVQGTLSVFDAGYRLRAPLEREVAAVFGGAVVLAGGLDSGARSTDGVFRMNPRTGRLALLGSVPQPFHDAVGAILGSRLLIFGGGASQSSAAVQAFDLHSHRGAVVAQLPRAISDLAAATSGKYVYLVGGYDGRRPREEIYRTIDGLHFELAGKLPTGLRYPAVAAAGTTLVVAGGIGPHGPVSTVYAFDTTTGRASLLGRLSTPLAHANAVTLGGSVYVLGGLGASAGSSRIDVTSRTVTRLLGHVDVSDAAAVAFGAHGLLIGGDRGGHPVSDVHYLRAP